MSALFPPHEWKKKEGNRSYRLPDSLCNGAVKPITIAVGVVSGRLAITTSAGEIRHSTEPSAEGRRVAPALIDRVERIFARRPFRSFDETSRALIASLIQEWENKHEPIRVHLYVLGHQSYVSLACCYLQIEQTAFFRVSTCRHLSWPVRPFFCWLVSLGSAGDEKQRDDDSKHYAEGFHDHLEKSLGPDRIGDSNGSQGMRRGLLDESR